jgi:hypothetical protein
MTNQGRSGQGKDIVLVELLHRGSHCLLFRRNTGPHAIMWRLSE